jgi:hypothetical protein
VRWEAGKLTEGAEWCAAVGGAREGSHGAGHAEAGGGAGEQGRSRAHRH